MTPHSSPSAPAPGLEGLHEVFAEVYDHLRAVARSVHRQGPAAPTLQTTVLVHEAYTRIAACAGCSDLDADRLLRLIPKVIRHVLIDHARARDAARRGGGVRPASLEIDCPALAVDAGRPIDALTLDESLRRLEALDALQASLVELHCFGGIGLAESARLLGVSPRTAARRWKWAKVWLRAELKDRERAEAGAA